MTMLGNNKDGNPWLMGAVGVVGLLLALAGLVHAARAGAAAVLSWRAQHGPKADVEQVVAWCRTAHTLYPWNYYFHVFTAELAYYRADEVSGEARQERLNQARLWCERGLLQNRHKSQLRRLKTRFLWEESPREAIRYWEAFTDWQFWEPHNHATLAELYARAGEFDKAEASVKWILGTPDYAEARRAVDRERGIWEAILRGELQGWGE